jgi:membrane associated rhomboid family serine protease
MFRMTNPPEVPGTGLTGTEAGRGSTADHDHDEVTYCYGHPDTPTRLHCSRCDKPICPRCAVPASVGQHCVWCVAEARKSAPRVRSTMQAASPAVLGIIAVCVGVYVLEFIYGLGRLPNDNPFINMFASSPASVAFEGEYYRLITPMFLHAPLGTRFGIFHILFNMYILRIYGPQVEGLFGSLRFLILYLTAGFLGGAASMAFGSCASIGLGASGAVFGVVGMLLAILYRRRTRAFASEYMRSLMLFVGLNLVLGFVVAGIDNFAHLGGLGSGLLLGYGMENDDGRVVSTGRQIATIAAVVAVGVALVAWRVSTMADICQSFIR